MSLKNSKKKTGYAPSGPSRAAIAEREERDFRKKRESDVKLLIDEWRSEYGDDWRGVVKKKFTAISIEYLVKTDDDLYVPGEIGVCSYTLEDGIVGGKLHAFIKPYSLPVGYTADAKNHSEVRHKIPYAGLENGIRDFSLVLNEVYKLVETKNGEHTAYCLSEEYKQIDSGLKYLNNNDDHSIVLICIEDLLQALCEWQEQRSLNRYYIQEEIDNLLSRTKHLFAPSIRCKFHDDPDIDIPHCSIATAHRIWYHTTDYLCDAYKIVPSCKHLPSASNSFRSIEEPPGDLISFQKQSDTSWPPPQPAVPVVWPFTPPSQELPTVPLEWLQPNSFGFRSRAIFPLDSPPLQRTRGPNIGKKFVPPVVNA